MDNQSTAFSKDGGGPRRITTAHAREFHGNRFSGAITNPLTAKSDKGLPFFQYMDALSKELNTASNNKESAIGYILAANPPAFFLPAAEVTKIENRIAIIQADPYNTNKNKEANELRKQLKEHNEVVISLNAASTKALALIHRTSGSDVAAMVAAATIGNMEEPYKILQIFLTNARQRYKGKAFEIKQTIMENLKSMGYTDTLDGLMELTNQITLIMTTAKELLMTKNPALNGDALAAARQNHATRQAMIDEQNQHLPANIRLPNLPPFEEPDMLVPIDPASSLPTSREIQTLIYERIDSRDSLLQPARIIVNNNMAADTPWATTMNELRQFVDTQDPSINRRHDTVKEHRANMAFQAASARQQHDVGYDDNQEDEHEQTFYDDDDQMVFATREAGGKRSFSARPNRCHYYDGQTRECDRLNKTGRCPFEREGHFGTAPRRMEWTNLYPPANPNESPQAQIQRLTRENAQLKALRNHQSTTDAKLKAASNGSSSSRNASASRDDATQG